MLPPEREYFFRSAGLPLNPKRMVGSHTESCVAVCLNCKAKDSRVVAALIKDEKRVPIKKDSICHPFSSINLLLLRHPFRWRLLLEVCSLLQWPVLDRVVRGILHKPRSPSRSHPWK